MTNLIYLKTCWSSLERLTETHGRVTHSYSTLHWFTHMQMLFFLIIFLELEAKVSKLKKDRCLWVFTPFIPALRFSQVRRNVLPAGMHRVWRCFTYGTSNSRSKTRPCRTPSVSWKKGKEVHVDVSSSSCNEIISKGRGVATDMHESNASCFQASSRRVRPMCRLRREAEKPPRSESSSCHQTEWV